MAENQKKIEEQQKKMVNSPHISIYTIFEKSNFCSKIQFSMTLLFDNFSREIKIDCS